ncbi:MAG: hypothetical protein Q9159_006616 [Coniocarpon cinnabarinum]
MADDDMLINFDTGSGPFISQPKFKGGKWRDRLQAKKSSRRRQEPAADDQTELFNEAQRSGANYVGDFIIEQPAKRVKISKPGTNKATHSAHDHSKKGTGNDAPHQIVSSLFSYNPTAQTQRQADGPEEEPTKPSNAPLSPEMQTFTSLGLSRAVAEHLLQKMQIKAPTSIQREAVAQLLKEDADAFIQAETGSGKTLAYLLPIVQKLCAVSSTSASDKEEATSGLHRDSGLFAIILAPTRELSKQISVVLETLLRCAHWIVSTTVSGGEKKKSEKARLRKGVNILIATPGRLADHLDHTSVLDVSKVRWLVMDEGDRLMELGFEKDITKILSKLDRADGRRPSINGLPDRRVNILCSATMKMNVQKLGELSLRDAIHIRGDSDSKNDDAADSERAFSAPAQLQQSFAIVPAKLRLVALIALLKRTFARKGSVMKSMVFMSCSDTIDFHYSVLTRSDTSKDKPSDQNEIQDTSAPAPTISSKENQVQVFRLHGSLPQAVRTSTLARYRTCQDPAVLVCTDVASRGLDLPNVEFVVEYDPAFSKDDHLHRIGRTARAGQEGRAMIFLMPGSEEGYVDILKGERADGSRHPRQHDCNELLRKGFTPPGLSDNKSWQDHATQWQLDIERQGLDDSKKLELARRAYQAHLRAYATHVAGERGIFDMTQLHLGHLAKAFALRDMPGSIRVPGLRPSKKDLNANKAQRKARVGQTMRKAGGGPDEISENVDVPGGKQRMQAKMREQARQSEFNVG